MRCLKNASKHAPETVAALRLLMLTGARVSEVLNLRWDEIGDLSDEGTSARLGDSKTGPRTIWLGSEAARLIASLPRRERDPRVFPKHLTSARLYTFWTGVRDSAKLPGLRIHDLRHSFASQGVMNGVGLPTVGRLLGHRRRATTAIYAHFDDSTLQNAANQAARVIARAMRYRAAAPSSIVQAGPNRNPESQNRVIEGSPLSNLLDPCESLGTGTMSADGTRCSSGKGSTPESSTTDGFFRI